MLQTVSKSLHISGNMGGIHWTLYSVKIDPSCILENKDAKSFYCSELVMRASGVIKVWVVLIKLVCYIAACCLSASPLYSLTLNTGGFVAQALCKAQGPVRIWKILALHRAQLRFHLFFPFERRNEGARQTMCTLTILLYCQVFAKTATWIGSM